jgi:hypothetical protein
MQPTPFVILAVAFSFTRADVLDQTFATLAVVFGGVALIAQMPLSSGATNATPVAAATFTRAAYPFSMVTTVGVVAVAPTPDFVVTPQMQVSLVFLDSSVGDTCSLVHWLIDDEP